MKTFSAISFLVLALHCPLSAKVYAQDSIEPVIDDPKELHQQFGELELLGVKLGQPVSELVECPRERVSDRLWIYNRYPRGGVKVFDGNCFQHRVPLDEPTSLVSVPGTITWEIDIPQRPSFLSTGTHAVTLDHNGQTVQKISILTGGADVQDAVARALLDKLGAPDQRRTNPVVNGYGMRVNSVEMVWNRPEHYVAFFGVSGRFNQGLIIAMTIEERQRFEQALKERQERDKL